MAMKEIINQLEFWWKLFFQDWSPHIKRIQIVGTHKNNIVIRRISSTQNLCILQTVQAPPIASQNNQTSIQYVIIQELIVAQ